MLSDLFCPALKPAECLGFKWGHRAMLCVVSGWYLHGMICRVGGWGMGPPHFTLFNEKPCHLVQPGALRNKKNKNKNCPLQLYPLC